MRQWATGPNPRRVIVTPEIDMFVGSGIWRVAQLKKEAPPPADVPQWYGDTIGFWDQDALIMWTSNIQGWNKHSGGRGGKKLKRIEIRPPLRSAPGSFTGIAWEAIYNDTEVLVSPVGPLGNRHSERSWSKQARL